ncbi:MAG TPA: trehalose-6-phosphate synthase [Gaiellales bacterium]|jgi:trehalose 6-phosphate synthase|nr:trehalose-6-phosphate synthase [Gaiellales bacterium]
MADQPLLIVSNRGPCRFSRGPDGEITAVRGGGGLVTALSGLAAVRPVTWIASALSEMDAEVAEEGPYRDGDLTVRLVVHDREEYDRYYNVFANPVLWFIHHYLWGLATEPSVDRNVRLAWDAGYVPVNQRFADAVVAELEAADDLPPVLLQDYHLFVAPASIRERVPDAVIQHFSHIPWPMPDYWRVLPPDIRSTIHESMLACDVIGLHTPRYVRNFLASVAQFTDAKVDTETATVHFRGRAVRVVSRPISVDPEEFERLAASEEVRAEREALKEWRPEKVVLRVDRTDPSKNVVRGMQAFELFLSDHPEWEGRVTLLAKLDPSRQDIPEYTEYMGAIQRAARTVNDRFYTTNDWQAVDLRISDNFPEAVAGYTEYDVLLVNAIFDGMNLIAKEAPLVNDRDGVLILSENAGAHPELGEHALTVNPFDLQEQADAIHAALVMPADERRRRIEGLRAQVRENDIAHWVDSLMDDLARARPEAVER